MMFYPSKSKTRFFPPEIHDSQVVSMESAEDGAIGISATEMPRVRLGVKNNGLWMGFTWDFYGNHKGFLCFLFESYGIEFNVGKTIHNFYHPPVITIFWLVVWLLFPVMGGLWHCFTHITAINPIGIS